MIDRRSSLEFRHIWPKQLRMTLTSDYWIIGFIASIELRHDNPFWRHFRPVWQRPLAIKYSRTEFKVKSQLIGILVDDKYYGASAFEAQLAESFDATLMSVYIIKRAVLCKSHRSSLMQVASQPSHNIFFCESISLLHAHIVVRFKRLAWERQLIFWVLTNNESSI